MAIDSNYIPAFDIETVILDKDTGMPLSGGLVYFEQDNQIGVPKPVYQITESSGNYIYTQLPNPMTLSSIGTFVDSLGNPVIPYFFPYNSEFEPEYYQVRVTSALGVPQFTRRAVPYIFTANDTIVSSAYENEISNPQFAEVLFDTSTPTYVYSVNTVSQEEIVIAPNWSIIVTAPAAGTVTVSQRKPTGQLNTLSNPGTLLNINSAGVTELILRQRIYGSPNLWGNGYLSGSFVGKTYSGSAATVIMRYSQSDGSVTNQEITRGVFTADGQYAAFPNSKLLPISNSTQSFPDAYVDIEFVLPVSTEIELTSIMLAYTGSAPVPTIIYDQQSYNRQIDNLFHYYKPQLDYKPIPSMLIGWDFPKNPAQALGTPASGTITGTPAYSWDQTIVARSGADAIAYTRSSVTGGIQFTTAGAVPNAFMIMQYLEGAEAKKLLGTKLSVNLNAYRGSAGGEVTYKIYLYRGSSAAVFPTLGNMIGSLAATGVFTKNNTAGQGLDWTEITRGALGTPSGTLSIVATDDEINNGLNDYGFAGYEITDAAEIADTDKFCMIVTFSYAAISTVITVDSVSLVPGMIPTRPAPKTINETLVACQRYYQKSFAIGTAPAQGVGANTGETMAMQVAVAAGVSNFIVNFRTKMRTNPTSAHIVTYSPVGASSAPYTYAPPGNWTATSFVRSSINGFEITGTTLGGSFPVATAGMHWVADARLGII